MKKIDLYIHPAYGKTATTFLQEKIFEKTGFVNLGKPHDFTNKQKEKLVSLQYKIFQPKYSFNRMYPVNYSFLIKKYVNELTNFILNSKKQNFILSDECIFDRINYFGYFNIYLLKEVIELLSVNFDISIKCIISIRKQYEYLISSYAYDNHRLKKNFGSFENFLNEILSDNNLSEIYQYDLLIKKIKKIYNCEILVLPMEELENSYTEYLNKIENFLNVKIKNDLKDNTEVYKNSILINNKKSYYIRTLDFRSIIEGPIENLNIFLKKYSIYKKNLKYIRYIKNIITPKILKKNLISLNENQKKEIQQHFKKSNQILEKITNLNLKKFNYY